MWPVTPVLPAVVADGEKVLASHENAQSQYLADLWTNMQTLNPWAQDIDGGGFTLANVGAIFSQAVMVAGDVDITGMYLVNGAPFGETWIADVDAAGFSLLNVGLLEVTGSVVSLPGLPSTDPGAGSNQMWYDPADGNRVKFAA